jgi:hypothetical protein
MIASRYFTHLLLWQPWRAQQNFSVTALLMQALNAPTKVGGKMDFALNYELSLYRSGLPPSEGMDSGTTTAISAPSGVAHSAVI